MTHDEEVALTSQNKLLHDRIVALERKALTKSVIKEALKEWLDEKFEQFGKWTAGAIAAAMLVALLYFVLTYNGWKHQ